MSISRVNRPLMFSQLMLIFVFALLCSQADAWITISPSGNLPLFTSTHNGTWDLASTTPKDLKVTGNLYVGRSTGNIHVKGNLTSDGVTALGGTFQAVDVNTITELETVQAPGYLDVSAGTDIILTPGALSQVTVDGNITISSTHTLTVDEIATLVGIQLDDLRLTSSDSSLATSSTDILLKPAVSKTVTVQQSSGDAVFIVKTSSSSAAGATITLQNSQKGSYSLETLSSGDFQLSQLNRTEPLLKFSGSDGSSTLTSSLTITKGGAVITGGITLNDVGLKIQTGVVTIGSGRLGVNQVSPSYTVDVRTDSTSSGAMRIQDRTGSSTFLVGENGSMHASGGATISSGVTVTDGGLVVQSGGANITANGLRVGGGIVVNDVGVDVTTGGVRVANGGISVTQGGLAVANGGISVVVGGVQVGQGGITVAQGGVNVTDGGMQVTRGGVHVIDGGLAVDGGQVNIAVPTTITADVTVGKEANGQDVLVYGTTSGKYVQWDSATNTLQIEGASKLNGGITVDGDRFSVSDVTGDTLVSGTFLANGTSSILKGGSATALVSSDTGIALSTVDDDHHISLATANGTVAITAGGSSTGLSLHADASASITATRNIDIESSAADITVAAHSGRVLLQASGTAGDLIASASRDASVTSGARILGTAATSIDLTPGTQVSVALAKKLVLGGTVDQNEYLVSNGTSVEVGAADSILLKPGIYGVQVNSNGLQITAQTVSAAGSYYRDAAAIGPYVSIAAVSSQTTVQGVTLQGRIRGYTVTLLQVDGGSGMLGFYLYPYLNGQLNGLPANTPVFVPSTVQALQVVCVEDSPVVQYVITHLTESDGDTLKLSDDKLQFRDSDVYIHSASDGELTLHSDGQVQVTAPETYLSGNLEIPAQKVLRFRDSGLLITSDSDGQLRMSADQTLELEGGQEVLITSTGTDSDAMQLTSSGGMLLTTTGGDIGLTSSGSFSLNATDGVALETAGSAQVSADGNVTLSANGMGLTNLAISSNGLTSSAIDIQAPFGGLTANTGYGGVTVSTSGAVSVAAGAASQITTSTGGLTLGVMQESGVSLLLSSRGTGSSAINLQAPLGGMTVNTAGAIGVTSGSTTTLTSTGSIDVDSSSSITVDAVGSSNFKTASGDMTIAATQSGADFKLVLSSAGTGSDAVQISASGSGCGLHIADSGSSGWILLE
eukprot:TRINITY_DN2499_c0_g1::TRINITY_DN2499_c0_g1_i1::g.8924::m.8924 TRINITY_DN2499_c0_g1::TRINITY_DN2499_c0_g1_i1::g.8924  ORF type:complete len:1208 (+),score=251.98,DUF2345/PF10106.4/2.6e+02,DUF2345/PF10106.4/3.1e+03,DUF2345/PF10106.4/0.0012,DUF2345/PF10106.4/2e+03,DUF2345/PF10106.4/1.7e+02,DUF2345/PF10106.4/0.0033,DUF2345/PF10106.4/2.8,Sarcoglycan_1/PF04790.8/1.8e+03,Sarcoglycan_1/PF04790.8/14,Sarcoglycan_1/PF04790.8/0.0016,Sarcoglycan_1/PF04790.8/1e+02,Lipocalin_3/PF12702.2/0.009,Lipocalin_3/PF127